MDRQRLEQVQQADLTESRINQDFVDWLKGSGPSWLLVILLGLVGFLGMSKWRTYKAEQFDAAWKGLDSVSGNDPRSMAEVATDDKMSGVFAIPELARLNAARGYLRAVTLGRDLSADKPETSTLSPEKRETYLTEADRLAAQVQESDDHLPKMTLHVFDALLARAAVCESRGDTKQAKAYFEQAAARAAEYPKLAELARNRAASVDQFAEAVTLPAQAQLPPRKTPQTRDQLTVDPALQNLLNPADTSPPTG